MGLFELGANKWGTKKGFLLASARTPKDNLAYTPFEVVRGSTGTYFDRNGIMQTAPIDTPRIDFLNDSKGHLLTEPQSTNEVVYSEDWTQSNWTKDGVAVSTGEVGQDGSPATLLTEDLVNGNHRTYTVQTVTPAVVYTYTVYAKTNGRNLRITESLNDGGFATSFNLQNGTVFSGTGSIQAMGDGWYKLTANIQADDGGAVAQLQMLDDAFSSAYQGDGQSGVYLWGAQLEELSHATSYIKTEGATVTRLADAVTNAGNSQVFNSSEGTFYFEGATLVNADPDLYISLTDGTTANLLYFLYRTPTTARMVFATGSVNQAVMSFSLVPTDFNKIALVYKTNRFEAWLNGVKMIEDTDGIVPAPNTFNKLSFELGSGGLNFYGKTRNLQVFPTALTDQQLIQLTT